MSEKKTIRIFTIGFTGKTASQFFQAIRDAGVKEVVDIRLNNVSQLAGFTKKKDLQYFLDEIAGIRYSHRPEFAPTKEILDGYKKKQIEWEEYVQKFERLLKERNPSGGLNPEDFNGACFLCSEPTAEHCHRRLVAEHLKERWGNVEIIHLGG